MQAETKFIRTPSSTRSSRSTGSDRPARPGTPARRDRPDDPRGAAPAPAPASARAEAPAPIAPDSPSSPGSRRPSSAFADSFVAKLRLVVQLLDRQGEGPAPDTEAEALLAGPLTVEPVHGRGGGRLWAVVKAAEPVAAGGRAAALCHTRSEALRLAAVLPSVPTANPYHLSDRPTHLGWPLHRSRVHVGHVSRLARAGEGEEARKRARNRRQALLAHLHVARYLAAHPEALAQVIESVGPEALPTLGRALARRVEAALEEQGA
jgi:hypothetical protein